MSNLKANRWLVKSSGGFPVPWTPILAKRRDMYEISRDEAARRMGALHADGLDRARGAVDGTEPAPDFVDDDASVSTGPSRDQVLGIAEKDELERLGREVGLELDKRKSVKTLQAELIQHLGL